MNRTRGPRHSCFFHTTGITTPSIQGACSPEKVVVASTSLAGIDVHVILLGAVLEAWDARHDRIVRPGHVDLVVDDVAGMGDPLAAAQELVVDRIAERIAHAAVMAARCRRRRCTAAQRLSASAFSIFDMVQIGTISDRSWMAGSANAAVVVSTRTSKPSAFSQPRIYRGTEVRVVTRPAAPYDHCLAHAASPF